MTPAIIKFETIRYINGIKHLSDNQLEEVSYIICKNLDIEHNEKNFKLIKQACIDYFNFNNT